MSLKLKSVYTFIFLLILAFSNLSYARGYGGSSKTLSPRTSSRSYSNPQSVSVRGYTKKNGTYVAAHKRSKANATKKDNWSQKGNVNPETGKVGEKVD